MQAKERERLMQRYHHPDLNPAACVAKCAAGVAIIGLIGLAGLKVDEGGPDGVADGMYVTGPSVQPVKAPDQPETALQESSRKPLERNLGGEHARHAAYRTPQ